jgi:Multicopper oxidase
MKAQRQEMVFLVGLFLCWAGVVGAAPTSMLAAADKQPAKRITPDEVVVPGGEILPYTVDGKWKVFNLVAEPVSHVVYSDGIDELRPYVPQMDSYKRLEMSLPLKKQALSGWGYNGSIPGPAIVVRNGDAVRIVVENKLPEATSILIGMGLFCRTRKTAPAARQSRCWNPVRKERTSLKYTRKAPLCTIAVLMIPNKCERAWAASLLRFLRSKMEIEKG